jgi:hypothetical protein
METIIIRNTMVNSEKLIEVSKSIEKSNGEAKNINPIEILESTINTSIDPSDLVEQYEKILSDQTDNADFLILYKLRDDMAININQHITVYRIIPEVNVTPWYYYDERLYIADSWWETDEEILHDCVTLSFVDFFIKYRAYGWYIKMTK